MKKLDQRGVAALEFCLIAVPLFTLIFAIFDFGRYAIAMQSLRTLATSSARAITVADCYVNAELTKTTPNCPSDPLTTAQKQDIAPFLYGAGLTPTVTTTTGSSALTVTASLAGFTMIMPIWGTTLNAPSVTTKIPF
ncbi:TadE/TadG family type IV pilus assembly protein [Bradyrhizobium oropedii]|uniref:TadE/TadG family type IV pilus assembly protein n=1 Tax=Bradyrhizobium oropedii TaxID=1571201 RepID=UPI001E3ED08C|nr:TadE family protein [Bradyrhizobium oropedii]